MNNKWTCHLITSHEVSHICIYTFARSLFSYVYVHALLLRVFLFFSASASLFRLLRIWTRNSIACFVNTSNILFILINDKILFRQISLSKIKYSRSFYSLFLVYVFTYLFYYVCCLKNWYLLEVTSCFSYIYDCIEYWWHLGVSIVLCSYYFCSEKFNFYVTWRSNWIVCVHEQWILKMTS